PPFGRHRKTDIIEQSAFSRGRKLQRSLALKISRRRLLQSGALLAAAPSIRSLAGQAVAPARAQTPTDLVWHHGLSLFGDLKYPADFKRFDYVNPDAPQGGVVRLLENGTFDNFNPVIDGIKGSLPNGAMQIYESLTARTFDEESSAYGL